MQAGCSVRHACFPFVQSVLPFSVCGLALPTASVWSASIRAAAVCGGSHTIQSTRLHRWLHAHLPAYYIFLACSSTCKGGCLTVTSPTTWKPARSGWHRSMWIFTQTVGAQTMTAGLSPSACLGLGLGLGLALVLFLLGLGLALVLFLLVRGVFFLLFFFFFSFLFLFCQLCALEACAISSMQLLTEA